MVDSRKVVSVSLILSFMVSILFVPFSYGAEPLDIGYANWDSYVENTDSHIQAKAIVHQNGNIVYVSCYSSTQLHINIISPTGSLELDSEIPIATGGALLKGIRVIDYDNDTLLIYSYDTRPSGTFSGLFATVVEMNMNTYSYTLSYSTEMLEPSTSTTYFTREETSNPIIVDENVYVMTMAFMDYGANPDKLAYTITRYNVDTNTVVSVKSSQSYFALPSPVSDWQVPYLEKINDDAFLVYYWAGVSAITNMEIYAITPNTLTHVMNFPSSNRMNYGEQVTFMESGIVVNETQLYTYLLYGSGKSLSGVQPAFQIVYLRAHFNVTFSSGTLIASSDEAVNVSPNTYPSNPQNCFSLGYFDDLTLETITILYPEYDYYEAPYYYYNLRKMSLSISDFYNMASSISIDSDIVDVESDVSVPNMGGQYFRPLATKYQITALEGSGNIIFVWYDKGSIVDDFTMTKTYTPLDSPLYLGTPYAFTFTFKNGGSEYQGGIVLIYIDDTLIESTISDINGEVNINVAFSSIGQHNMTVRMYKHMLAPSYSIDSDSSYWVISVGDELDDYDEDDISLFGTNLMSVALELIPVAIMVMFPAFYLGKVGGMTGFFGGMIIGTAIGVRTSMIPVAYAYLIALVIVMGVVMAIRSGGISTGGNTV